MGTCSQLYLGVCTMIALGDGALRRHHRLGLIDERLEKAGLKSRSRARHKLPFGGMDLEVTMTPSGSQRLGIKPHAYF